MIQARPAALPTHRQSYKDIGVVSLVIPLLATVVVIILGTLFGGF